MKCFICDGPHWARECPKRKALNALVTSEHDRERVKEDEGTRMGSLQLLSALQNVPKTPNKGLIFVDATINGKVTKALVDTGASHNFVSFEELRDLISRLLREGALSKQQTQQHNLSKELPVE